jgi:hypothetical protein
MSMKKSSDNIGNPLRHGQTRFELGTSFLMISLMISLLNVREFTVESMVGVIRNTIPRENAQFVCSALPRVTIADSTWGVGLYYRALKEEWMNKRVAEQSI